MPFSIEQFLSVFERYNAAAFPIQFVLNALALTAIVLSIRLSDNGRAVSAILALFWAWMGIVYHLLFFTSINPAAFLFAPMFVVQSLMLLWIGARNDRFCFRAGADLSGLGGWLMIAYALLIYPLLGYVFGHIYPRSPTFGAPCPTTIFTFGLLLWQRRPIPLHLLVIPIIWSLIGFTAALSLGIIEDTGLLISAFATAAIIGFRRYRELDSEMSGQT